MDWQLLITSRRLCLCQSRLAVHALNRFPFIVQTKPHGHGDVHSVLFSSGILSQWSVRQIFKDFLLTNPSYFMKSRLREDQYLPTFVSLDTYNESNFGLSSGGKPVWSGCFSSKTQMAYFLRWVSDCTVRTVSIETDGKILRDCIRAPLAGRNCCYQYCDVSDRCICDGIFVGGASRPYQHH